MSLKEKFPNQETLQTFITQHGEVYATMVRAEMGHLEEEYLAKKSLRKIGWFFLGGGIASPVLLPLLIGFLPAFVATIVFLYIGFKIIRTSADVINHFHHALNEILFPVAFSILDLDAQHMPHTTQGEDGESANSLWTVVKKYFSGTYYNRSSEYKDVLAALNHSELITESRNRVKVDDVFISTYKGHGLQVAELDVKHVTRSSKQTRVRQIFTGSFISFDLNTQLQGKTFVSSEGDTTGLAHMSFWNSLSTKGVQTTELEWNDFEKLLHVATNNPSEARYILPPDFMVDLYEWWNQKKQNIRISFIENKMYILFPDREIRFGATVNRVTNQEITSYLETICTPLLHVMHLVEDVSHQFRNKV
jgi:hypothetical protein